MSDENIDEKIEKAPKVAINEEQAKGLADILGAEEETKQEPEQEPEQEQETPKDGPALMPEDLRDKLYDTQPLSGFEEGDIPGVSDTVEITEKDKQLFLKALLTDENIVLDIPLCDGQIIFKIRSKSTWEQTLAYEATVLERGDSLELDYYQSLLQLQKHGAVLQVMQINDSVFSTLKYDKPEGDWKDQVKEVRDLSEEIIETMDSVKLGIVLNALRMFEYKMAKMSSACNSGNFWKPAG